MKQKNFLRLLSTMLLVLLCMTTYGQNNALHFDGDNDYVKLEHFSVPDEFTLELWLKTNSQNSTFDILSWSSDISSSIFMTEFTIQNDGQICYLEWDDDTIIGNCVGSQVSDGEWHHVALVRKAYPGETSTDHNIFLYMDGNLVGDWKGLDINDNFNSAYLTLGALKHPNDINSIYRQFIEATMDELRIWDYAKSQTEIQAQMNDELTANEANYSNLIAYYSFNHGVADGDNTNETELTDQSVNGRDGELVNFSLENSTSNWVDGTDFTTIVNDAFVTTWQVKAGETITIPINENYTYNYTVDWGDGTTQSGITEGAFHTYTSSDTYTVSINGEFPAIYFNSNADKDKIQTVKQWGDIEWQSMLRAFQGCANLQITAEDAPDLSLVMDMFAMFHDATAFDSDIGGWNTEKVTNMSFMFQGTSFNQDISRWDVSNVTDMGAMFRNTSAFNQNIGSWNVEKVENMSTMFNRAGSFNQDLGDWDLGSVNNMLDIFDSSVMDCASYSATLIGWADINNSVQNINLGDVGNENSVKVYSQNASTARQTLIDQGWTISGDVLGTTACTLFEINAIANLSINENTVYAPIIPTITGTPTGTVTWTLDGKDAEAFTINDATGQVEMIARNFESPQDANADNVYEVTITATDNDNNSASEDWTVTINNVIETVNFTINAIANVSISENTAYTPITPNITGVPIGTVTWTLGGEDAEDFSINDATGQVEMIARDFEDPEDANTNNIYEVTITATDNDNNSASEDWTVTINNVIETVNFTINAIANVNIGENTAYTSVTPTLTETPIGMVTWILGGADAEDFSINDATGQVEMIARDFEDPEDANTDNIYEVIITVTDSDNNSANQHWTVTVTCPPIAIAQDIIVELDTSGQGFITPEQVNDGSGGGCTSSVDLSLDRSYFSCDDVGTPVTVTLTVVDQDNKSATATAQVTVKDVVEPMVVTQDITVALDTNGQATISAQEIDHGSFDACTGIDSMSLDISSFDCPELGDVTVTLTVTDTAGNSATRTATVTITAIDTNNNHIADTCESLVIAPGGFSPNGDGIGDTWVVENMENYPGNTVQVFNQWGEPVFEANGYQNDWNGISNKTRNGNKKLPVGAYLYIINLNEPGITPKIGWLYINY